MTSLVTSGTYLVAKGLLERVGVSERVEVGQLGGTGVCLSVGALLRASDVGELLPSQSNSEGLDGV